MAYLKFSRDKRGYEHFYLVQPANRGKGRPRMLYWFRTPPGVKVGRSPFDPDMRRALEAQHPDIVFDWEAITHTPIPPPVEPDRWRERRRLERASRAESDTEESASTVEAGEHLAQPELKTVEATAEPSAVEVEELDMTAPEPVVASSPADSAQEGAARQGHRRRRRRRGRPRPQVQGSGLPVQGSGFPVPGSGVPVQGSEIHITEAERAGSEGIVVQDSGEPGDENGEP